MLATWIETAAKGRLGGPVRAGMWSAVVIGTHPIEGNQRVWLELSADELMLGLLPAYWIENKGGNSFWHAPMPPQGVGIRLHYRAIVDRGGGETAQSAYQDAIVRPNLPDRTETGDALLWGAEGLVGNRLMTVRVDARGSTYDLYFPTAGLHSSVRPREGDLPQSRCHFRAIVGGLAVGRRVDWFTERAAWDPYQHYQGATNVLMTKLSWRHGPINVLITDFAAMGDCLPLNAGQEKSAGQYIKRFNIKNEGNATCRAYFAVYVQTEVNGGVGDVGLSWHDIDQSLLAINRGHGHANRKLSRDATVEFALALDNRGEVECEPTGPNEAILFRTIELPAGGMVTVNMLVSGAFTGWSGDRGTFEHWLRPALTWFRSADLDQVEQSSAREWDDFIEPIPDLYFPKPAYAVHLRRSALAAALHADAEDGAIASGFDRGLSAYCWPRDAIWVSGAMERLGHHLIGRKVYQWLNKVRQRQRAFLYWFQKYSLDGVPEWETPAVDQTALIPWGLERHYRRTGDLDLVAAVWPMIEQAAVVCCGDSGGHPGLRMLEDLNLISSAGTRDQLFGAFLYSNACVVAGLRAAARLATRLGESGSADRWNACADRIWNDGILRVIATTRPEDPGLIDHESGRFIQARRLSKLKGLWSDDPTFLIEHSHTLDINMLGLSVPFGLLPAADPRMSKTAEGILRANDALKGDTNVLARTNYEPSQSSWSGPSREYQDVSSLATLWMVRFLIQLGRETGHARYWTRALGMLEGILSRVSELGLVLLSTGRGPESARRVPNQTGTAWGLHAMLIDTMLDFAGLDYDAVDHRLSLRPVLPGAWPQTGIKQSLACGEVSYRLERPIGGKVHHLNLKAHLKRPVSLEVDLTCPELKELGPWHASPQTPEPLLDSRTGKLRFSLTLPPGASEWNWTWG
ncbi:MAG: glycosyl hydrolase [Isosphaerales bacterium]